MMRAAQSWSVAALTRELKRDLALASSYTGRPHRYFLSVQRVAELAALIKRKGGNPAKGGLTVASLDTLEKQLSLVIEQAAVCREMVKELRGSSRGVEPGGPDLRVVRPAPSNPIEALRVEIAHFIAQGVVGWDMFIDRVDRDLVLAAQRQFAEFGPGRSAGRRSVDGFRKHVMAGVATAEMAGAAQPGKAVA